MAVATSTLAVPLRPEEAPATQRARQPALRVDVTLIPRPIDQNWCAHWRNPMDMMRQG